MLRFDIFADIVSQGKIAILGKMDPVERGVYNTNHSSERLKLQNEFSSKGLMHKNFQNFLKCPPHYFCAKFPRDSRGGLRLALG